MSYPNPSGRRSHPPYQTYQDPYAPQQPVDDLSPYNTRPLYPPAALAGSSYSLHETYVDEEKGGYTQVQPQDDFEEEERTPFARQQHLKFDADTAYGPPSLGYGPHGRQGNKLTRRETNAEAFRQRQKALGRAQTKKVVLRNGHFIADYAVPTAVRNANKNAPVGQNDHPEEFTHLRYTAATCDPDDFSPEAGWSLRASSYGRQTELLIAITYYNEDKLLMARTLHGVMTNITDIVSARWSEFRRGAERAGGEGGIAAGVDAWKRIVVTLVFDGLDPADKETLDLLATIGIYQDAIMQKSVDGVDTEAHIFEYTSSLSMNPKLQLVHPQPGDSKSLVPVQFIFVLKAKNAKKINSHRWLFNALGRHLKPEVCILLDAGTKPGTRSLYYLWESFHHNKNLGGSCGEIHAMTNKGRKLLNPLVAAQNFEYKISNILDKTLEAAFGYVSVLPGAFSAYRYRAIQGRPLEQYFHGDHSMAERLGAKGIYGMSIFKKNMFLAEDRILCFELVAKAKEKWTLGYVKPAKGETDVPESAAELIGQRRRWLNGSFAAGIYALVHFPRMYKSNHSIVRLFFFHLQVIYQTISLFMSWFQLGNWFLSFTIIITLVADSVRNPPDSCWTGTPFEAGDSGFLHRNDFLGFLNWVLIVVYSFTLGLQIILALGNRPKSEKLTYTLCFFIFGALSVWLFANTIFLTIKALCPLNRDINEAQGSGDSFVSVILNGLYGPIFAGLVGTFGVYVLASILYLDPLHLLTSLPWYLVVAISFTNVLNVYALANLHDVSWGTKGSDKADTLPAVHSKKTDADEAVAEVSEKVQQDIDEAFEATVKRAVKPLDTNEEPEKPTMDDQNRTFRTRLFAVWLGTNAILAIIITRLGAGQRVKYFQAILWITFGLSGFRLVGFLWFMFGEIIFRLARLCRIRSK